MRGLSPVAASGGHSSSRCVGLSLSRPLVAERRLQTRRLSNCSPRAQPLRGMWDLPRPGLEPVSPALAGRLSTTAPPGKPLQCGFNLHFPFYWWAWTHFHIIIVFWNSLVNCLFVFFTCFSVVLPVFFLMMCKSSLYILLMSIFHVLKIADIFFHSELSFSSLYGFFLWTSLLN